MITFIDKNPPHGKTNDLIDLAQKGGGYIVCMSKKEADRIAQVARNTGRAIRFPITHAEFLGGMFNSMGLTEFYIDNVEYLLQKIAGIIPVKAITITEKENSHEKKT